MLVLLAFALPAYAQLPEIKISVYNDAGVMSDILTRSETRAAEIFLHARLQVNWINCDHAGQPHPELSDSRCQIVDGPTHLVLRIIDHGTGTNCDLRFGVTFLDANGVGRYSDVFWDKAAALGKNYNVDVAAVLGTVIAHEIGHLMLRADAHAVSGIMRDRWERGELQRIQMGTLLFLPGQEKRMRKNYSSRLLLISDAKRVGP